MIKRILVLAVAATLVFSEVGTIAAFANEIETTEYTEVYEEESGESEEEVIPEDTPDVDLEEAPSVNEEITEEMPEEEEVEGEDIASDDAVASVAVEEVIKMENALPKKADTLQEWTFARFEEVFVQNETYPKGKDLSLEVKAIELSDDTLMEAVFDEESCEWKVKALLPGKVTVTITLLNGETEYKVDKTITITCKHPYTIEKVQLDAILGQAREWIGCKESDGSHKKIIDIYNNHKPLPIGYKVKYTDHWCATFVSALGIATGYDGVLLKECGCQRMIALYSDMDLWEEDESVVPAVGWVIFYDWNDDGKGNNKGWSDHVGIVESVEDDVITVIEGNNDGKVKRRTIDVNGRYIRGYGMPFYGKTVTKATFSKSGKIVNGCGVCDEKEETKIPKAESVTISTKNYTYDGTLKTPTVKVWDENGDLIDSSNYKLTYSKGRKEVGQYQVTVEFQGLYYSGTKTREFYIHPQAPEKVVAKLSGGHDDVKVTWSECTGADGYNVYYKRATAEEFSKLGSTTSRNYTKKNLYDGKEYEFKVVPYFKADGEKIESTHSNMASVYTLEAVDKPAVSKYSSTRTKVTWNKVESATGYQVSKSTSKTKTNVVLTTSKLSGNFRATKGKTYYYKVRSYQTVSGKRIYGPWSVVQSYKLK